MDFETRLETHKAELYSIFETLYGSESPSQETGMQTNIASRKPTDAEFAALLSVIKAAHAERPAYLQKIDAEREKDANWYRGHSIVGMMLYIDNFATNLNGVRAKLDYIEKCGVNYIHLMPFLDTPSDKSKSDGGYAVRDFRKVQRHLGTIADLQDLTAECHRRGVNICMDFVMNHTSSEHEWAKKALQGDEEFAERYFIYPKGSPIPAEYEKTVPQVFPTTAPGNFTTLPDGRFVMTTFYPYQWDLNYANPKVLTLMTGEFLYLANRGIDVLRLDAVPYIWKKLGTQSRNLPEVHSIVRLMKIICQIVCPGVLLLGEVVMEPKKVVPYFGSVEKPECDMLYNVTTMATIWNTVATRDARLLRRQLDSVAALPKEYVFLNYLRCHDDIGWGLDYDFLRSIGQNEVSHKHYLNEYFLGKAGWSTSTGALYNSDPRSGDARFCGTTASMCGLQTALSLGDAQKQADAIRLILTLHAYMLIQSGIPVIYSGDEVGQLNDVSYCLDAQKAADSRYIHRGKMDWNKAAAAQDPNSIEGKIFGGIERLLKIRRQYKAFSTDAAVSTIDLGNNALLCMRRTPSNNGLSYSAKNADSETCTVIGVFNFSDYPARVNIGEGEAIDIVACQKTMLSCVDILPRGYRWLMQKS